MAFGHRFGSSYVVPLLFLLLAKRVATLCYGPDQVITNNAACRLDTGDSFCCGPGLYVPTNFDPHPRDSQRPS